MLTLIAFIVSIIGSVNWFCIGLLQFDFVAGLFGSQSSIFSRIIYVAVGLSAFILLFNLIKNKGKISFDFKNKRATNKFEKPALAKAEASSELHKPEYNSTSEEKIKPYDLSKDNEEQFKHEYKEDKESYEHKENKPKEEDSSHSM